MIFFRKGTSGELEGGGFGNPDKPGQGELEGAGGGLKIRDFAGCPK